LRNRIVFLAKAALIAAIYTVLTFIFAPISFGPVQLRVSEVLTVLPVLTASAIPGLFTGCIISNLLVGGLGPIDMIFGSLATLMAAFTTYKIRKNLWLAPLPPVIFNGIIVGSYLPFLLPELNMYLIPSILSVMAGELVACYVFGLPLLLFLAPRWKYIDRSFK
jgi:uncharacterized membrane protein